jgi:glutaminase
MHHNNPPQRPPAAGSTAPSPIQACLLQLHARFAGETGGAVASYIPELAKADPALFGIAVATVDGQLYEVGDTRVPFTIQSISKPLVYGVALEDRGRARVLQAIGVEPSGDAFNSISLEPGSGRPLNPMINAGAIATASLVAGASAQARLARVLGALSAYAGRPLAIDDAVYQSERDTGHRNRAIGHMLRNHGIIDADPEPALDLYFRQCSALVDGRDLALIAATLANGGVNPATGQRAVRAEFISDMLSVMTTCGMYDFAGGWVTRVGLPAKSGVGGGIIAVLPGQLGIGVFSPALDARGNSLRGVQACEALSAELGLHFLQPPRPSASTVRARYTLAQARSKRQRTVAENQLLDAHGAQALVVELQGDLHFATIEPVLRLLAAAPADDNAAAALRFIVLDFKRVRQADAATTRLLAGQVHSCAGRGQQLVLTRVRRGELLAGLDAAVDPHDVNALVFQPELDAGLAWCERGLLARYGLAHPVASIGQLAEHRWCAGMGADDVAVLQGLLQPMEAEAGALLVQRGSPSDALYFVMRGEISVVVDLPGGGHQRLSTVPAGLGFGETALLEGGVRSADVRADTAVHCATLSSAAFNQLQHSHPRLAIALLRNLLRGSMATAVRLTAEVRALEG